ncbi:flavin reductase family protein [Prosthecomicrobium sp. N25]|uniref:flavin reductase family protein n=1 Tax=Prosthecomicrobium sp. N25 TaxID=3129254 RepID=UPI00307837A9
MFYETDARPAHLLPHDPFKAIVAPRPIGWISAVDRAGRVNLSPYSFFNAVGSRPPLVMFSSEGMKDAASFVAETMEFVCNLATWDLRDAMNATSAPLPRGTSEFGIAGLTPAPCRLVKAPRVKEAPVALECKAIEVKALVDLAGRPMGSHMVIGQVVGVHIDEAMIRDGRFDLTLARPIARCGYKDYAVVTELFQMERPPGG